MRACVCPHVRVPVCVCVSVCVCVRACMNERGRERASTGSTFIGRITFLDARALGTVSPPGKDFAQLGHVTRQAKDLKRGNKISAPGTDSSKLE